MDRLPFVSTIDPHSRTLFSIALQAVLHDLDGLDVQFPTLGPVQLVSDGYRFYEAPLLSSPPPKFHPSLHSVVDVKMNPAPSLPNVSPNIVLALLRVPAPPPRQVRSSEPSTPSTSSPFRPRPLAALLTRVSPLHRQPCRAVRPVRRSRRTSAPHSGSS
jgi:hypothetical protein